MHIKLKSREKFAPFWGRTNIAEKMQLGGMGVEIGTHRGLFAEAILKSAPHLTLYCVDPYLHGYDKTDPASHGNREDDKSLALERLKPFGERAVLIEESSTQAAERFITDTLSFVYIDGCHQADAVKQDLETWWPKVKSGGVLAGHDIICPGAKGRDGLGWGKYIRPVVNAFAESVGRTVYIVRDSHSYWSYYLVK